MLEEKKVQRIKKGLRLSLLFSVMASLILILFTVDEETFESLLYIQPRYLLLAFFLSIFIWWVGGLKLCILARALQEDLPLGKGVRIFLVGAFVSNVTPFASGSGPVQVFLIHQQDISVGRATTLVLVQSVLRIILLGFFSAIFYFFFPAVLKRSPIPGPLLDVGVILGLFLSFFLLILIYFPQFIKGALTALLGVKFLERWGKKEWLQELLGRIYQELEEFHFSMRELMRGEVKGIILAVFFTILFWVIFFSIPSVLLLGLGKDPFWGEVLIIQTVLHLILLYIPIPGKSGAVEFGFASLFAFYVSSGLTGILTVVWRLLTYFLLLLAGGLLSIRLLLKKEPTG